MSGCMKSSFPGDLIYSQILYSLISKIPFSDLLMEKEPLVNTFISLPKDKEAINCAAFVAGIIEAMLEVGDI